MAKDKVTLPLRPDILFYYCQLRKCPTIAKIRQCCAPKGCPHLGAKPRKNITESGTRRRRKEKQHAKEKSA